MKTVCVYHSRDLDGWMSAAIVKHWFMSSDPINTEVKTKKDANDHYINFIGYDYGQPIPDLSSYERVVMCDVSFPKEEMLEINLRLGDNFIWIDHHQRTVDEVNALIIAEGIPMEGLVTEPGELAAACELTWTYFFSDEPMPEIVRLLGRYDCFAHKNTKEETKVLEFQYGARAFITNYEEAYKYLTDESNTYRENETIVDVILFAGRNIYHYLCAEAKQTYSKSFPLMFYWTEPNPDNKDVPIQNGALFLCVNQERFNPINFGIDYHKDGYAGFACFWLKDSKWNFSLYNDDGNTDCSAIAKTYGGGGHKGASGMILNNIQLQTLFNQHNYGKV